MTTCLILAAGNAERHNGGNKPLLKVDGETLLERTVRLIGQRDASTWIVTHRDDLKHEKAAVFHPKARRWVVETLLSTRELWAEFDDTVVLLGDVFYTDSAMNKLFDKHWKCVAFGVNQNIHAMRFSHENYAVLTERMGESIEQFSENPTSYGCGKLWLFFAHWLPNMPRIDFGDETTDFDSPQEHKRFIEKYARKY